MNHLQNKDYAKYKLIVKKWEKEFLKLKGRIPSKHDIKEASSHVKYAYKLYFNFKSEVLETSLVDIPFDADDEMTSGNNLVFTESEENNLQCDDDNNIDGSVQVLPTTEEIGKLMDENMANQSHHHSVVEAMGVWGTHLNNKVTKIAVDNGGELNHAKKSHTLSNKLFKSCSFNKRNPRKSLSFQKSIPKIENETKADVEIDFINQALESNIEKRNDGNTHFISENKSESIKISSVNPIQAVMSGSNHMRNIDSGWLSRCSGTLSVHEVNQSISNLDVNNDCYTSGSVNANSSTYGLKNLNVQSFPPPKSDSYHSDFVENSESEEERLSKKIRPVVKKIKIDSDFLNSANQINGDSQLNNVNAIGQFPLDVVLDAKNNVKSANTKNMVKTKKKKPILIPVSDSEDDLPLKRITRKTKRNVKSNKKQVHCEHNQDEMNKQLEEAYLHDDEVVMPRFLIQQSILKDHNLVDGLSAALKPKKGIKKNIKSKSTSKHKDEKDSLQKKIEDGSLNENFVRINIEKKVYVRGKKTVNYSTFKKQQWKNKKKMLHSTPEFPTGGLLKCFKCGEPGHMSRYCPNQKGVSLLPLDDCLENSPHPSLQEAETLANTGDKPNISELFSFESITQIEQECNENDSVVTNTNLDNDGKHSIPDTFLKLLATSSKQFVSQDTIEPLYSPDYPMETPDEVKKALNLFGYENFRTGQETAVMRILSGQSTLVTLSTGSGKSLCYQLPAYIYAQHSKCITLVISPLVSLMEDQVTKMPNFLHAACLHTNQSPTQREKIIDLIKSGNIHILLISPEAVVAGEKSTGFGSILRQLPPIAFACIDEVHCVSQWSHNFRPSYLMICRVLREKLNVKCVLGLTATATKPTILNIVQHLEIKDGVSGVVTNLPLPDNLILTVSRDDQRDRILLELLQSERFVQCHSIIIYCIRRDECERVSGLIRASMQVSSQNLLKESVNGKCVKRKRNNWVVDAYHAGMSAAKRRRVQQAFMHGELRIVVATVAFGMGIDKSDIRGVIHYNMPSSFESYVQEVGRAGRDGLPAQCHVFIDSSFRDKDELLRHIHANSIERHVIRKLLQKVFIPCSCNSVVSKVNASDSNNINIFDNKCQGHEVAFSVEETVTELDIPSENIATLLCYLELHPKKYAKVLSNVYINCKITSYGGLAVILNAAETCAPLAMALALQKNKNVHSENQGILEFCVVEVAAAIGWESGMVKYHLKNLEWIKQNDRPKKSLLRVEFNTLGFRIKSPGDLTSTQLDEALDSIYERTQLQEKTMLYQLQEVSKSLIKVSYTSIFQCSVLKNQDMYMRNSNDLKAIIRSYFLRESLLQCEIELDPRSVNNDQVVNDVRGLISTYRDCTFTGRAVARILQGISSPNFPALVWGRCRYWRSHISGDFYKLTDIAKQQIILMR